MINAIYPGSFDPLTLGHMDIIKRAANMFDNLTIAVLDNMEKMPLFSVEERVKILEKATIDMKNVRVIAFNGLLVDYAKENDIHVSVRGLRSDTDFEYELMIAQNNNVLSEEALDTVFLATKPEYIFISSSGVKEIAHFGGDITKYVPPFVKELVYNKYVK